MSRSVVYHLLIVGFCSIFVKGQMIKFMDNSSEIIRDPATVAEDWEQLEYVLQNVVNHAIKNVLALLMDGAAKFNFSSPCIRDSMKVVRGIQKLETWAMKFVDSTAKDVDGILTGTTTRFGAYDECIDNVARNEEKQTMFSGKYCMLYIKPHLPPKEPHLKYGEIMDGLKDIYKKGNRGQTARNARRALTLQEPEELVRAPHAFVINRGQLGKYGNELLLNFRKLMEPYTASQLRVQKSNVLKDFISIAGPYNVSHMVVFTKTEIAFYLRLIRLPRGPTLTFKIHDYVLARDVVSSLKKAMVYDKLFQNHPLLVLNNFSGEGLHFKLMTTMFQSMFPSINVNKVNLNTIRRCLVLDYSHEDECIYLRHYSVKVVPCGLSKAVKKLIQNKVPDLGQYQNFEEYMNKAGNFSESEAEMDGPTNQVVLPQAISSRGNIVAQKSAIRLFELGPRIKLELIKIEDGIMSGEVLYHKFVKKTPEEIKTLKKRRQEKKKLKEKRKAIQEENVRRKKQAKNDLKQQSTEKGDGNDLAESSDDDYEWYKKEVGDEDPDEDVVPQHRKRSQSKRKSVSFADDVPPKRKKSDAAPKAKISSGMPLKRKESGNVSSKTKEPSSDGAPEDKSKPTKAFQELMRRRKKKKEAKNKKSVVKKAPSKVVSSKFKKTRPKSTRRRR